MSNFAFLALSDLTVLLAPILAGTEAGSLAKPGPWRPPEWNHPALWAVRVPGQTSPATKSVVPDAFGNLEPGAPAYQAPPQVLVFDAVLKAEHRRDLRRTEHPIQASASSPVSSITDHAYLIPPRVTLEIGMSDAQARFDSTLWTGNASKSVSAYQTLVALQTARTLVTLSTRLETYQNMLIEAIAPYDSVKTLHGLRAVVVFSQIFVADLDAAAISDGTGVVASARPQTTGSTTVGLVQGASPTEALVQQHSVSLINTSKVPGAGMWSSTNVSRLKDLL